MPTTEESDPEGEVRAEDATYVLEFPCKVKSVDVQPRELQTRVHLILREFRKARQAETLQQVAIETNQAVKNLEDLGVFHRVDALLSPHPAGHSGTCAINVDVKEKALYGLNAGTQVTLEGRVTGAVRARLRNLTGNCEHHSFRAEYGGHASLSHRDSDFAYRLRLPRMFAAPVHAQMQLHKTAHDLQRELGYCETVYGSGLDLISSSGRHQLGYEFSWIKMFRGATESSPTPPYLKPQLGDHIKSALKYTLIIDGRIPAAGGAALNGTAVRLAAELAGLMPDDSLVQFVKARADVQRAVPLGESAAATLDASLGAVVPILRCRREGRETLIRERFFLGGVSSLRGFQNKGVGRHMDVPRPAGSLASQKSTIAAGGDVFASLRTAVNYALPFEALNELGVRGIAFADTGSIAQISGDTSVHEGLGSFWNNWRLSMGVGLKIPFALQGSLEVNFVSTLKQFDGDKVKSGLQIGFSAEPYACTPPQYL